MDDKKDLANVDWKKIKEIICGIAEALEMVCSMIPSGPIKNILCGIVGILKVLCNSLAE